METWLDLSKGSCPDPVYAAIEQTLTAIWVDLVAEP